jgi:hypothetical protein
MAIGAEQTQVVEPVVGGAPIDVIQLEGNLSPQPVAVAATAAAGFQPSFAQQPSLQSIAGHRGGGQQGFQALLGAETGAMVPSAPAEMLGVELEPLNRGVDLGVVAACRFELQLEQNLANRSAVGYSFNQVSVGPASAPILFGFEGD